MKSIVVGSFFGFVLAAAFLAACGGGGGAGSTAAEIVNAIGVIFDNSDSGLSADNVQDAIDEIDGRTDDLESDVLGLQSTVMSLQTAVADLQSALAELQSAAPAEGGSIFVRWGNATAPTGTTLLYSGVAACSPDIDTGSCVVPVVVKAGDAGPSRAGTGCRLLTLRTSTIEATEIADDKLVKAAVCYSPTPTTTIWGTHTPPSGWHVLYKGYALGSRNNHTAGFALICVDMDNFDSTAAAHTTSFPARLFDVTWRDDAGTITWGTAVKAAVIAKNAE